LYGGLKNIALESQDVLIYDGGEGVLLVGGLDAKMLDFLDDLGLIAFQFEHKTVVELVVPFVLVLVLVDGDKYVPLRQIGTG
jgi:hypothetical protein